jgi:hypothetical protein
MMGMKVPCLSSSIYCSVQKKDRARGISRRSTEHGIRLSPVRSDDVAADEHRRMTMWHSEHGAAGSGDKVLGSWATLGLWFAQERKRKERKPGCVGEWKRKGERKRGVGPEKKMGGGGLGRLQKIGCRAIKSFSISKPFINCKLFQIHIRFEI